MKRLLRQKARDGVRVDHVATRVVGRHDAHGKMTIVDGRVALVGSLALSASSLGLRRELEPARPRALSGAPARGVLRRRHPLIADLRMIHEIRTIDAHTAGEPLRLVVDGLPAPEGATMLAKRRGR